MSQTLASAHATQSELYSQSLQEYEEESVDNAEPD